MYQRIVLRPLVFAVATSALVAACSEIEEAYDGPTVGLKVAPLNLPSIANACYAITVSTPQGPVWSLANVCSTQYGNSQGDITYIGPCDADFAQNTVTLELTALYAAGSPTPLNWQTPPTDFQNPCPPGSQTCSRAFDCNPNADTFVEFNLTVMRAANQGFFDIAVNFEDIFCSAKVDCKDEFLFNSDGVRDATAILALACTAGEGADTHLYMSDVSIHCEVNNATNTTIAVFDPAAGPGNHPAVGAGNDGYAVYQGTEELGDYNKAYWNVAISIDEADLFLNGARKCWLRAWATASDGPLEDIATPVDTTSPYIDFNVYLNPTFGPGGAGEVITATPNAGLSCREHPMNTPTLNALLDPGVRTVYDTIAGRTCFQNELKADFTTDVTTSTHFFNPGKDYLTSHVYREPECYPLPWEDPQWPDYGPFTPGATGSFSAGYYHDVNGNRVRDAGEPLMADGNITVMSGGPPGYVVPGVFQQLTTTGGGMVTFSNLQAGLYFAVFSGNSGSPPASFSYCQGLGYTSFTTPGLPPYYFTIGGVSPPSDLLIPFDCITF